MNDDKSSFGKDIMTTDKNLSQKIQILLIINVFRIFCFYIIVGRRGDDKLCRVRRKLFQHFYAVTQYYFIGNRRREKQSFRLAFTMTFFLRLFFKSLKHKTPVRTVDNFIHTLINLDLPQCGRTLNGFYRSPCFAAAVFVCDYYMSPAHGC